MRLSIQRKPCPWTGLTLCESLGPGRPVRCEMCLPSLGSRLMRCWRASGGASIRIARPFHPMWRIRTRLAGDISSPWTCCSIRPLRSGRLRPQCLPAMCTPELSPPY
jgi:hypothetical protein